MTHVVCILLFLFLAGAPGVLCSQELAAEVDRILATPQSESGEVTHGLVQLGRRAVPFLIERLDTYRYPIVIVEALGRIGDKRATFPLLSLLDRVEPFAETKGEYHAQRISIIAALREIGDSRAEPVLQAIFINEKGHIGTRLAAATALAGLSSPDLKEQARAFIMKVEEDVRRGQYGNLRTSGPFQVTDLDQALSAVGTDEARKILIDRLMRSGLPHEELALINLLEKSPDQEVAMVFLDFCEKRNAEPYTQLQAAKALAGLGQPFPHDRLLAVLYNLRPGLSPRFQVEVDKLIEEIR
jgi:HEAT repeat protein